MKKKRPEMSEEEERMQRALGTLPRFEVQVERTITKHSFARIYVTAGSERMAEVRAVEMASQQEKAREEEDSEEVIDDTGGPISWADNQEGDVSNPVATGVEEITPDHYLTHRFEKKSTPDENDDDKLDVSTLGLPI